MRALIQHVSHANVIVDDNTIGEIQLGILALIGIEKTDTEQTAEQLLDRLLRYRIFRDDEGKMNLNIEQAGGGLLLVPQFTLVAETHKGNRPGFSTGMPPAEGEKLFHYFVEYAKQQYATVETGKFGAHMHVNLCNDGPVTFLLESK